MKLLFIANAYPPPLEGGQLVYLYNLVSNCPASDVTVYTNARLGQLSFDSHEDYRIVRSHFRYNGMSKIEQFFMTLERLVTIGMLLTEEKVDVLHAGTLFNEGMVCWLFGKLFKIPYILYGYGEEFNSLLHRSDRFWGPLKKRIYCFLIQNADGLVSVSDYTSSLFIAFGADPKKICKIIPMICPSKQVSSEKIDCIKNKYRLAIDERVILSVGRLSERKGQGDLIVAMPQILNVFPNTILIIVGRGIYKEKLQKLVDELGLRNHVILSGFVDDDELTALYKLCDVFALPHRELEDGDTEGCPTVFLEANAHGKPVVGGDAGGVRDAILENVTGLIVNGRMPDQIATALIRLLGDRQLAAQLGENGRQRVYNELTPQKGAERLLFFCRKILEIRPLNE